MAAPRAKGRHVRHDMIRLPGGLPLYSTTAHPAGPLCADSVENVENREVPKISRMLIFNELYRCNAS